MQFFCNVTLERPCNESSLLCYGEIEVNIELEKELDKEIDLESEVDLKSDFSFFRKFFQDFFHLLPSTLQLQTPLPVVFQSILSLDIFLF